MIISVFFMRQFAKTAVLDPFLCISEAASALFTKGVKRTVTEKTVEFIWIYSLMTGKEPASFISEVLV